MVTSTALDNSSLLFTGVNYDTSVQTPSVRAGVKNLLWVKNVLSLNLILK